ncbi:MAG TPA: hypothetical protein VKB55_17640 [Nocardioidaceae bacterium]|jgi:hypothetical protein|nr:hypothetical protein [Nocardioidaceae bacterium]
MELLVIVLLVAAGIVLWINRVKIAAKLTGQSEDRVKRYLERRKRP